MGTAQAVLPRGLNWEGWGPVALGMELAASLVGTTGLPESMTLQVSLQNQDR